MKKETFLKIAYICLSIMLIALTIGWVISGIDFVVEEVSAEEITDNSILDFNQQFNYIGRPQAVGINFVVENNTIHAYGTAISTGNYYLNGATNFFNIIANHKYYININSSDSSKIVGLVYSGGSQYGYSEGNYSTILSFTSNQSMASYLYLSNGNTYNTYITCNVVDLSQMFGVGNEPTTIEEVKKYLPLNNYRYTTSTLITNTYLEGFNQGAFSMQDGYTIEEVASDLVNTAYPIEINNNEFNKTNNMLAFNGTIGLNTKYTLIANDTIILDLEFLGDSTIDILVQGNSGNYIKLTTIMANQLPNSYTSGSGYTYYSGVITLKLPVDTNTLLFKGISVMQVYNVKYKTFNLSQAIVDSFQNGVNSVDTQAIRDKAFEDGKNWAINHNTDTAWGSSWEFIGSAFSGVGDILSIELLPNIPLWTFIAIPLLFGLIALLYKLIGG